MPGKGKKTEDSRGIEFPGVDRSGNDMVNTFSGGMMRRLEIAQALVKPAKSALSGRNRALGLTQCQTYYLGMIKKLRDEYIRQL